MCIKMKSKDQNVKSGGRVLSEMNIYYAPIMLEYLAVKDLSWM